MAPKIFPFIVLILFSCVQVKPNDVHFFSQSNVSHYYYEVDMSEKFILISLYSGMFVCEAKQTDTISALRFQHQKDSFPVRGGKVYIKDEKRGYVRIDEIEKLDTLHMINHYSGIQGLGLFLNGQAKPRLYNLHHYYFDFKLINDSIVECSYVLRGPQEYFDDAYNTSREPDPTIVFLDSGICEVNINYGFFVQKFQSSVISGVLLRPGQLKPYPVEYYLIKSIYHNSKKTH